jgi:hypothetical protein
MVRELETIIEVDMCEDSTVANAGKSPMESKWEGSTSGGESLKECELSEPEHELDPLCASDLVCEFSIAPQTGLTFEQGLPKRNCKRRHSSFAEKAPNAQQNQHSQGFKSDAQQHIGPAYIRISDLSVDWSRYLAKYVNRFSHEPLLINTSTGLDAHEILDVHGTAYVPAASDVREVYDAVVSTTSKRKSKKSLIDKAVAKQRKEEMSLQNMGREIQQVRQPIVNTRGLDAYDILAVRTAASVLDASDAHEVVEVHDVVVSTTSKRNRKKSLIDKAVAKQRREEMSLQSMQRKMQQVIPLAANFQATESSAYCSLCVTRKKNYRCHLCGSL